MEALSGNHLNVLVLHVLGLLDGLLGHVVLLLIVHRWVPVTKVLHGRGSYIIILYNFLNVHCGLLALHLLLWEHEVVLGSELGGNLGLSGGGDLLGLFDHFTLHVFQAFLN